MKTLPFWKKIFAKHHPKLSGLEILRFIGPGLLVTVGFIDPGNWASNVAAGSNYGYYLLWIITLSTIMLIFLQHYAAHLGIATGLCLSEASSKFYPSWISKILLLSALGAAIATALAALQKDVWVGEIGQGFTTVTVLVQQPPVKHEVKMKDFLSWLNRQGRTPAEVILKQKLEKILGKANHART